MKSKIAQVFNNCRKQGRAALITYTVAGDNTKNNSLKILEKFELQYAQLKMINSLFLNRCYHGRYYVDWSVMNYKNLEHFKTKFKTWWERVTDNTNSSFMNTNIQTKIVPVKGYNSYNVARNTTNNNSKKKNGYR